VPPRGEQDIRLDALVPADRYAVHVRATTGRVSALLRTTEVQGLQQLGWDWVPPADPPARHLLVPGTSGTGSRTLRLAAPGTAGAVVSVSLLGKSGTTRPDGLAAVAVPAGSVLDVALPGGDGAAAYVLDSTAPVTAGVLTRAGAAPGDGTAPGELAWSAAAPALDAGDQAVLPYVPTGAGQTTDLLLGAPGTSGDVRVTPLSASGATAAPRTVSVANGHAVLVPLGTAGTAARPYAVLVQVLPGSGPVTVAATLHETAPGGQPLTGVTTLPLRATVSHVVVPRVSEAPGMRLSR